MEFERRTSIDDEATGKFPTCAFRPFVLLNIPRPVPSAHELVVVVEATYLVALPAVDAAIARVRVARGAAYEGPVHGTPVLERNWTWRI